MFSINVNKQLKSQLKSSPYAIGKVTVISAVYTLQVHILLKFHYFVLKNTELTLLM